MFYKDLVDNLTLLLSLGMVYSLIHKRWSRHRQLAGVLLGVSFGFAAVIGMMSPLTLMPGVVFDGRSVLVSLAGLFGGPAAAGLAAAIASLYRYHLGGAGAWTGIGVIWAAAFVGTLFHRRTLKGKEVGAGVLWLLGFVVHAAMLFLMLTLPADIRWRVLEKMFLPVLLGYPLTTVLLGMFFVALEERLRLDDRIYRSERLLNEVQQLTGSGGWEYTVGTGVMYWTEQLYRLHGFEPGAAAPRLETNCACIHADDRETFRLAFRAAVEEAVPFDLEVRFLAAGGEARWVRATGRPIMNGGRVEKLIGDFIDVTHWKKNEEEICRMNNELEARVRARTSQLEASNQELAAFSFTVSHNLRAPLRALSGFAELLRQRLDPGLDAKARHYLEEICRAARQMGRLVDDLLAFFNIGRSAIGQNRIDMNILVEEARALLRAEATGRQIDWRLDPLPPVSGDADLLRLALFHILDNALKFTRQRPRPLIEMGWREAGDGNEFFVRDNGIGIDGRYTEKLFGLFERLHPRDEPEGTGVGLAVVRRVIELHGGKVWAEGRPAQGFTLFFWLPARPSAAGQTTQTGSKEDHVEEDTAG